ncbi:c-type cytochrome biogenesis protein CcsB [Rhodococcus qingshengii]|uniref:c-type cytochrome biogenesis protein CcsB n=1 Tax=Rhodococcus qingshengii TaxID=334542 RepID=UPI0036DDFC9E
MNINEGLARFGDLSFASAFGIYVLAMVLSVFDLAGSRTKKLEMQTVVGAHTSNSTPQSAPGTPGKVVDPAHRTMAERCGRTAVSLCAIGFGFNVAAIILRGLATERWPLGNLYEYALFLCAVTVGGWLLVMTKHPVRALTTFMLVPVIILLFVAASAMYAAPAPLIPALRSYWIAIHVTVIVTASGILLLASLTSLLFLIAQKVPDSKHPLVRKLSSLLPTYDILDRVSYRMTIIGFPLYSVGVICGAIWAEAAWGRFWGWDPKETVSFIAWVIYAAYLHSRATSGWAKTRAAWINIAALCVMLFNLFFINFVISGLHSYAGLN